MEFKLELTLVRPRRNLIGQKKAPKHLVQTGKLNWFVVPSQKSSEAV